MSTSSPTLGLALLVAAAGGAGAVLRAVLIHHIGLRRADPLPVGTLIVNGSGSLVLGLLTGLALYHGLGGRVLAVAGVGLCGGYTTWSTASWEAVHLAHTGHRAEAAIYTVGSLLVCIGCAAAAIGLAGLL
jgi:CrcB protein